MERLSRIGLDHPSMSWKQKKGCFGTFPVNAKPKPSCERHNSNVKLLYTPDGNSAISVNNVIAIQLFNAPLSTLLPEEVKHCLDTISNFYQTLKHRDPHQQDFV